MDAEKVSAQSEGQKIIDEAHQAAKEIQEQIKKEKITELEEAKDEFKKEKDKFYEECDSVKQEALREKKNAEEEAEGIVRQACLKLSLAEEKEKLILTRAVRRAKRIKVDMEVEYENVQKQLTDGVSRMAQLFEYIAEVDQIDIEE